MFQTHPTSTVLVVDFVTVTVVQLLRYAGNTTHRGSKFHDRGYGSISNVEAATVHTILGGSYTERGNKATTTNNLVTLFTSNPTFFRGTHSQRILLAVSLHIDNCPKLPFL